MKEGTVSIPPYHPPLSAMMTYYLFRWYCIWGGAEAAGVKPPRAFRFFEYFYSAGRIPFF